MNTRQEQQPNCKTGLDLFANALREFLDLKPIPRPRADLRGSEKRSAERVDLYRFYVTPVTFARERTPIRGSGSGRPSR